MDFTETAFEEEANKAADWLCEQDYPLKVFADAMARSYVAKKAGLVTEAEWPWVVRFWELVAVRVKSVLDSRECEDDHPKVLH